MKSSKCFVVSMCFSSLLLITGCSGGGGGDVETGVAPRTLSGRRINVVVSTGEAPFSSTGSYVFTPAGDGTSGTYQLMGNGGVQSNVGTYTYNKAGQNQATLIETEESGTIVNNKLVFDTPVSGSIRSTISSGGFQSGSFTLN